MTAIARTAAAIVLVREGAGYAQSKAVFEAARARAGLRAPPERRGGVGRLTVEEELRFLDEAYVRGGRTGLMLQKPCWTSSGSRTSASPSAWSPSARARPASAARHRSGAT